MSQLCPNPKTRQPVPMSAISLRPELNVHAARSQETRRIQPRAASREGTSNYLTPHEAETRMLRPPSTQRLGKGQCLNSPDQSDLSSSQARPLRSVVPIGGSCFAAARQEMDRYFVSVETRLLFRKPERSLNPIRVGKFLSGVAEQYNKRVGCDYPQMQWKPIVLGEDYAQFGDDGEKWVLMDDTMRGSGWGIRLRSPSFEVDEDANWRDKIKMVWQYMYGTYDIINHPESHTYIHATVLRRQGPGGYYQMDLTDMRKIAQCAIHFEPGIVALTPKSRRKDLDAMSNWIDNKNFLDSGHFRRNAIKQLNACATTTSLIGQMCPDKGLWPWSDEVFFAWNFRSPYRNQTVEFRSCGANLGWERVAAWALFISSFVQASVQVKAPESLIKIPANIGALKEFIGPAGKDNNLDLLFDGKWDHEYEEPRIIQFQGTIWVRKLAERLKVDGVLQNKLQGGG